MDRGTDPIHGILREPEAILYFAYYRIQKPRIRCKRPPKADGFIVSRCWGTRRWNLHLTFIPFSFLYICPRVWDSASCDTHFNARVHAYIYVKFNSRMPVSNEKKKEMRQKERKKRRRRRMSEGCNKGACEHSRPSARTLRSQRQNRSTASSIYVSWCPCVRVRVCTFKRAIAQRGRHKNIFRYSKVSSSTSQARSTWALIFSRSVFKGGNKLKTNGKYEKKKDYGLLERKWFLGGTIETRDALSSHVQPIHPPDCKAHSESAYESQPLIFLPSPPNVTSFLTRSFSPTPNYFFPNLLALLRPCRLDGVWETEKRRLQTNLRLWSLPIHTYAYVIFSKVSLSAISLPFLPSRSLRLWIIFTSVFPRERILFIYRVIGTTCDNFFLQFVSVFVFLCNPFIDRHTFTLRRNWTKVNKTFLEFPFVK